MVDPARSEPANLLVAGGVPYLIDAGAGTARQIVAAGVPLSAIHQIFITHHHLDHTAGLEPLISLDWIGKALAGQDLREVHVYGPPATRFLVDAAINYLSVSERIFRAGIPRLAPSKPMFAGHDVRPGVVFQDANVKVSAMVNAHFGHPSRARSGQPDQSFSYRFDTAHGAVVFTGDTGPDPALATFAKGADVLVSEVYQPAERPMQSGAGVGRDLAEHMSREHLSPTEVGKLASAAGVKRLVLTHLVLEDTPEARARLIAGIRAYYTGPVQIGEDLMRIDLAGK